MTERQALKKMREAQEHLYQMEQRHEREIKEARALETIAWERWWELRYDR